MNGKIGENRLFGFLAVLVTLAATTWIDPETLPMMGTVTLGLYGLFVNKKKEKEE